MQQDDGGRQEVQCAPSLTPSTSMTNFYVNDLAGVHLDFWVAQAEGIAVVRHDGQCLLAGVQAGQRYAPSADTALSDALVVKHRIETFRTGERWAAEPAGSEGPWGNGATPVEAALRAIVAAKFGDTVQDDVIPLPMMCFWLAFVASGSEPPQFVGHAIVDATGMDAAIDQARRLGLYPGTDARVYRVNDDDAHQIPAGLRGRALTAEEAASLGWQGS